MGGNTVQAFISYAREDRAFVEDDVVPLCRRHDYDPWWDVDGISGGEDFERRIIKALRESDHFLLVMSPDSQASEWVKSELNTAFGLGIPVIPLLYRESDPLEFHIRLPRLQVVDVRQRVEPLARVLDSRSGVNQTAPGSDSLDLRKEFALIAATLLRWQLLSHLRNLARETTGTYQGGRHVRHEVRHLCDLNLLRRKPGRKIAELEEGSVIDLADLVELTEVGRELVKYIR
jgi:TIR domain